MILQRLIYTGLFIFLSTGLFAHESAEYIKLKKQLQKLQIKKENTEAAYWNKKKNFIDMQANSAKRLKEKENKFDELVTKRNNYREKKLKLESKIENKKNEIEKYNLHILSINDSFADILKELKEYVNNNYPMVDIKYLKKINKLGKYIKLNKHNFIVSSGDIIKLCFDILSESSKNSLTYGNVLTKNNKLRKAWKLKLGNVYLAYITGDFKHAGILLHSDLTSKSKYKWFEDMSTDIISKLKKSFVKLIEMKKNKNKNALIAFPMDVLLSKAVYRRYSNEKEGFFEDFFRIVKTGGPIMFPLILIAIASIVIMIERARIYQRNHTNTDELMEDIIKLVNEKKFDLGKIKNRIAGIKGPIVRMLESLFNSMKMSREEAYNVLQENILHELPYFEKRLSTLKIFGVVAPLLGLLGTVSGMISLFDVITIYGTKDPKLLAGGISEALITTETGLIVAVPIILMHRFLMNRVNHIIHDMERYGLTLLNTLWKDK